MLVCLGVGVFLILGLRLYLIWENNRRVHAHPELREPLSGDDLRELVLLDQTDRQMQRYRYVY